jgi:hypothetical protein
MARSENFYEKFAQSVAPSIYGSLGEPSVLVAVYHVEPAKISRKRSLVYYSVDLGSSYLMECD